MAGANIRIAPTPYTAPLIKSIQQLEGEGPDAQLTRWRVGTGLGRELTPTYSLLAGNISEWAKGLQPDYYVRTSFAHLPGRCLQAGMLVHWLCPYDPLRGSFPHHSKVNQIPDDPAGVEMVLLREFNPICPRSLDRNVYINYRTNVLRNNMRHLCSFGPVIQIYQLSVRLGDDLNG